MKGVNIITHSSSFKVNTDQKTTVEDLIIETCKNLKIGPIARHLFALRIKSTSIWLQLNQNVEQIPYTDFEFRLRFNVPDINRLRKIDQNAYDFYFNQVKDEILHNQLPKSMYRNFQGEIIGLSVVDMFRAINEDGLRKEHVIKHYRKYIPKKILKRHFFFVKKPVVKKLNEITKNILKFDMNFIKSGYLEQFNKIFPDYLSESFKASIKKGDESRAIQITVDPYRSVHSGISMKYELEDETEHLCAIDDLCYLNMRKEGTVEISRKNGIPLYIQFNVISDMISFVSLLDGYYRLIVKWTFNLCRDLPTPSLQKLQLLKCHGPISDEFAYHKLEEKRNNEVGCYILRESILEYDTYYIDVCTKTSTKPVTYKIETTNNEQYRLSNTLTTYASIPALIAAHKSDLADFILRECLPPSEFDQSNLLICQTENHAYVEKPLEEKKELFQSTKPLCVDVKTLTLFKDEPMEGRNQFTNVYRAVWSCDNIKKNVVAKVLKESYAEKYVKEFLSLNSRWAFVKTNAVVKFYGFAFSSPISMIMEYLPLGQLNHYLENADGHIPVMEVDLVEAASYLANALWYLEEVGFVHGNIRCRKILVFSHSENSFVVKLSDPGLHDSYTDADLHWIPPEHHNNRVNDARYSVAADVWAYGTTIWEIFSYGKSPPLTKGHIIKKFYKSGKNLPQPVRCPDEVFHLMRECWINEPDLRKRPQAVMRDINQILYQVYNTRHCHMYSSIIPSDFGQADNVSNELKKSDDISSSLFSDLTLTTLVEVEERCSADLSFGSDNTICDMMFPTKISPQPTYQRFENTTSGSMSSQFSQPDSLEDDAISSMQSIFELDREWKLILNGRIGEGFHGEVFRGMLLHWHDEEDVSNVAVKKLKAHTLTRDRLADFDREISIMKKLDHPNIVKIKGIIRDPDLCLVLEYIEHGSLRCYLNINRGRLATVCLLKFALDVAKGMAYLSEKKIVHRDLAARNILVVNDTHVKISDFGLAQFIGNNNYYTYKTERHLPVEWYAPESLERNKFSPQSDVWSYGVTLYEMFTHGDDPRLPIPDQSINEILKALKNEIRLQCPADCPLHVYSDIMRECWQYEAEKRPTFQSISKMIEELFLPG